VEKKIEKIKNAAKNIAENINSKLSIIKHKLKSFAKKLMRYS
jgi:hypothetical protein